MVLRKLILILVIQVSSLLSVAQFFGNWELIQTIPSDTDTIHSLTYEPGKLAINFNNGVIEYYSFFNDRFNLENTFYLKWIWDEWGTMKFSGKYLYVSIDGYKYYKINLENGKVRKTTTYNAGFFIISRIDVEYFGKEWIFKLNDTGDLEVYYNRDYYLTQPPDSLSIDQNYK